MTRPPDFATAQQRRAKRRWTHSRRTADAAAWVSVKRKRAANSRRWQAQSQRDPGDPEKDDPDTHKESHNPQPGHGPLRQNEQAEPEGDGPIEHIPAPRRQLREWRAD